MNENKSVIEELESALEWCAEDDNPNGSVAVKIWVIRDALELITSQQKKI